MKLWILKHKLYFIIILIGMWILALPTARTHASWQEEWEGVLKAAKKEGSVAVGSTVGADFRMVLTEPFEKKYGIRVTHLGMRGGQMSSRIRTERRAGKYLWDVTVQGTTSILAGLKPSGALDPLEPEYILPEVKDPKNWIGGKLWYSDKNHLDVLVGLTTRPAFMINTKLVDPKQFKSLKDLLDPKWKGKIVVGRDPRRPGPGSATFTFFYINPKLGPDFIRDLLQQDLGILQSDRQALDWLGQGKYRILIGPAETISRELMNKGVPIGMVPPQQMREGGSLSPGPASLALINRAPHPNAARVYINWLLSKEGQSIFSKTIGIPSLRLDAPTDHLETWRVPVEGYVETYNEAAIAAGPSLSALLKKLMGGR